MIPNNGLLWEHDIREQKIELFEYNGRKAFFERNAAKYNELKKDNIYPFDIFSAAFYLISRYEEYLPHEKDSHGRFSHTSSLAWRENFIHMPLVNM